MKVWKKIFGIILVVSLMCGIWGVWGREKQKETGGLEGQEKTEKPIKFAVMSDIHSDWINFQKALQKAKDNGAEFVVVVGDLTTMGTKNKLIEAEKRLNESGLKYYIVPGNHDVWWGRKYGRNVWQETFGESFTNFKINGEKFILLNNGDGVGGFEGFGGIGQKQWLKKEIEECLRIYCLVFMHMPLNHPTSLHVMGEDNPKVTSESGELIKLLNDFKANTIFAGHLHFSSEYEKENLKTNIVGAVAADRNFQSPKFLEVEINGGKIKTDEVFIE